MRTFHQNAVQLGVTMTLVTLVVTLFGCIRTAVTVEEVDRIVRKGLPLGSDKKQIHEFIDTLKIDQLEILRDKSFQKATNPRDSNLDPEKVAQLGDRIEEFITLVILKSKSDGIMTFENISVVFYVDKEGLLIGYVVKRMGSE